MKSGEKETNRHQHHGEVSCNTSRRRRWWRERLREREREQLICRMNLSKDIGCEVVRNMRDDMDRVGDKVL